MQQRGNQSYQGIRNKQRPHSLQVVLSQEEKISEPYIDQHISRLELSKPRYGTMKKTLSRVFFFIQQTIIQANGDIPSPQSHFSHQKRYSEGEKWEDCEYKLSATYVKKRWLKYG